jgi:hypothetical protein
MRRARGAVMVPLFAVVASWVAPSPGIAQAVAQTVAQPQDTRRVLLIPLDDRPSSRQFPMRIAEIAGITVVTPPRELLGRFTAFGDPEAIATWLRAQDLASFESAIVSLDMLAYGGLVASRVNASGTAADARRRLDLLRELKRTAPRLPILAASTIMRLAPTADGVNESFRVELARWAELSDERDSASVAETGRVAARIPAAALTGYRETRTRNATINRYATDLARDHVVDQLILSQDDARARGVHLEERARLQQHIDSARLRDRISVQAGTDEVAMLLLTRAVLAHGGERPHIAPIYSSPAIQRTLMPYEDVPLETTVRHLIQAAGGEETTDVERADHRLFVYTSRGEAGAAARFVEQIRRAVVAGDRGVIVADIDPKGDVQGSDTTFVTTLIEAGIFAKLDAYASWNTAGNTLGTALAQGMLHRSGSVSHAPDRARAQHWFLLDRLFDDYLYHAVLRPEAMTELRARGWNPTQLDPGQSAVTASMLTTRLRTMAAPLVERLAARADPRGAMGSSCPRPVDLRLRLPWSRLFESELDFTLAAGCR